MNSSISILFLLLVAALTSLALAGPGGRVVIINRTPYTFKKIYSHSYQMHHWGNFPDRIGSNTDADVYVEFDYGFGKAKGDDAGEVDYQLEGTGYVFRVGANHYRGPALYGNGKNLGNANGKQVELGWNQNSYVYLYLGGNNGNFDFKKV